MAGSRDTMPQITELPCHTPKYNMTLSAVEVVYNMSETSHSETVGFCETHPALDNMQPALCPVPVEERPEPHSAMAEKFLPES